MSDSGSDRRAGAEHLQAAARELIAAARSFLDVAEEAIADSEVVDEAGAVLGDLLRRAAAAASPRSDGPDNDVQGSGVQGSGVQGSADQDRPDQDRGDRNPGWSDDAETARRSTTSAQPPEAGQSRVRRIDVE